MATVTAPVLSPTATGRAIAAFTRTARTLSRRAGVAVARGGATALGAAGLASVAVGAGAQWGWPVGLMVGGPLAVWFASLLPAATPEAPAEPGPMPRRGGRK